MKGPPARTQWGGYHLARPGGPPGAKGRLVPAKSNLKAQTMSNVTLASRAAWQRTS